MRLITCLLAFAALAVAIPASATAQGPQDTYGGEARVLGEIGQVGADAPETSSAPTSEAPVAEPTQPQQAAAGDLPFTGSEALIVALMGLALAGAGLGLRRLSTGGARAGS